METAKMSISILFLIGIFVNRHSADSARAGCLWHLRRKPSGENDNHLKYLTLCHSNGGNPLWQNRNSNEIIMGTNSTTLRDTLIRPIMKKEN